jgi:hypothetical protein
MNTPFLHWQPSVNRVAIHSPRYAAWIVTIPAKRREKAIKVAFYLETRANRKTKGN